MIHLYEVTFQLGGSWSIAGYVEEKDQDCAVTKARDEVRRFNPRILDGVHVGRAVLKKRDCDKAYRVKTTYQNFDTGENRSYTVRRLFRTRKGAEAKADSLSSVVMADDGKSERSRCTAEVIEVSA